MATMAEISSAINQIDAKKETLHQSFLHLQSQLPSSFNLPFNWSAIDSHFTSLQSSINSKFNLLQTLSQPPATPPPTTRTVPARPELISFCENSDGLGLVRFITLESDDQTILSELPDAYGYAPDAPGMVLDAMVTYYHPGWEERDLYLFRRACLIMLRGLLQLNPVIPIELKDKAMEMAMQWNQKRTFSVHSDSGYDRKDYGFLLLVGVYGLIDRFSMDDITDCFLSDKYLFYERIDLCRRILSANNISNMIQTLIDKDRILTAVEFSIKLKKTDEFPLARLLEELKLRTIRKIEERPWNTKYLDDRNADVEGIHDVIYTLKSIIRCIDENHLKDSVVELVKELENEMESPKRVKQRLRKKMRRATAWNQRLLSSTMSEKPGVEKVQPTAESAALKPVPDQPELESFCKNSDGEGLMRFIAFSSEQQSILSKLPDAYRCAPDAPAMVLDAMVVFYSSTCKDTELRSFRSGCLIMLEGLIHLKPEIMTALKDKAMDLALQWNQKWIFCPCEQKALGFVLLVGAYGLIDRFNIDDITGCFLIVATDHHTIDLCRQIIPANKIKYMIQKLVDKDMILTAVKFSIELQKTDEFPPVGLLEEMKLRSMRVMEEKREETKYLIIWEEITREEICTLKSIIDCIDENHLESEHLKDCVMELVNQLEDEIKNSKHGRRLFKNQPPRDKLLWKRLLAEYKTSEQLKKRKPNKVQLTAKSAAVMPLEKPKLNNVKPTVESDAVMPLEKPKLNNVKPTVESDAVMPVQSVQPIQESHPQKHDLAPDHVGECCKSPHGSGSKAPHTSLVASPHGSTGADTGYNFYVPQLQPPPNCGSNGWISD